MFITSWIIDIRVNIQIWLLYRRHKSEWYHFWWATIQDIAACACKVWTLFGQACGQEECSQTTTTTTMTTTTTTDKSGLHRLATDILSWANNSIQCDTNRSMESFPIIIRPLWFLSPEGHFVECSLMMSGGCHQVEGLQFRLPSGQVNLALLGCRPRFLVATVNN